MRKRLIKLTAVMMIGGMSSVALATPASAATLTASSLTAFTVSSAKFVTMGELFETSTSTTTSTFLTQLATAAITMSYGIPILATVVR